ncbi:MAG: crossover junction endodeoxyribonuclease RuvC [Chloroflexi bacterium]|nr:crossover junction endodeoxyribonuclease RuvC [Chloroflexota bacterium]
MLVLGLDPGLAITGYGLVESDGQHLEMVSYGVIRTAADLRLSDRLVRLHDELTALMVRWEPKVAAVEELFFSTNARTAMVVGEARGVLLLTLAQAGLAVHEYTPMQVKQAITGYGGADKHQMQHMVRLLLGLEALPEPDDAADALAVSICHHHSAGMAALLDR